MQASIKTIQRWDKQPNTGNARINTKCHTSRGLGGWENFVNLNNFIARLNKIE